MACVVEFSKNYRFNFVENKDKQKIWIEAILHFTDVDFYSMSASLNVSADLLHQVYQGQHYFCAEKAELLGQLFLLFFSD